MARVAADQIEEPALRRLGRELLRAGVRPRQHAQLVQLHAQAAEPARGVLDRQVGPLPCRCGGHDESDPAGGSRRQFAVLLLVAGGELDAPDQS